MQVQARAPGLLKPVQGSANLQQQQQSLIAVKGLLKGMMMTFRAPLKCSIPQMSKKSITRWAVETFVQPVALTPEVTLGQPWAAPPPHPRTPLDSLMMCICCPRANTYATPAPPVSYPCAVQACPTTVLKHLLLGFNQLIWGTYMKNKYFGLVLFGWLPAANLLKLRTCSPYQVVSQPPDKGNKYEE